jgi:hypothetical protein
MKRIGLGVLLALTVTAAMAQTRPSTTTRSCSANRQSVQANGAIVLGTGRYTYDRFVRNRSFCEFDETTEPAWVPSRDRPSCFIGYRCTSRDRMWFD